MKYSNLILLPKSWLSESIRNSWGNFKVVQTSARHWMIHDTFCSLTCSCLFSRSLDMCIMWNCCQKPCPSLPYDDQGWVALKWGFMLWKHAWIATYFCRSISGFNSHTAPKRNLHKGIKRTFWYMYVLACSAHNVECTSFSGTYWA